MEVGGILNLIGLFGAGLFIILTINEWRKKHTPNE